MRHGQLHIANAEEFLGWCATLLRPQGCVAIVLDHDGLIDPAELIAAGRNAGLSYLQHVVAAIELNPTRHQPDAVRLRVHTDILLLIKLFTPLCRLRYNGYANRWGFAIWLASKDGYEASILPTGYPFGTAEEALDCAYGLYLNEPSAWLAE